MIYRFLLSFTLLLLTSSSFAQTVRWDQGVVIGIDIEAGFDAGFEFSGQSETLMLRLCPPTKPGYDPNPYFFEILRHAHTTRYQIDLAYSEGVGRDPVTGRNKLCVVHIKY
jgi:hypothetical protein